MTLFIYHYVDERGRSRLAWQRAQDAVDCCRLLAGCGIYPVHLVALARPAFLRGRGITPRTLAMLFRQLALAVESGVPLLEALHFIRQETASERERALLSRLESGMLAGKGFSQTLADEAGVAPMICQWLAIGERQGRLAEVLLEVTRYLEEQERFKKRLEQQLLYPLVVLAAVLLLGAFLSLGLLPVLTRQFMGVEEEVPLILRIFLILHDVLAEGGWLLLLAAVIALTGWYVIERQRATRSPRARRWLLRHLPALKQLAVLRWYVPFARLLGQMLAAGVPAGESLAALERYFERSLFASDVKEIAQTTRHGGKLSQAVAAIEWVPPLARQMLQSGERVGRLPEAFRESAAYYEELILERVGLWVRFIEPLAIVLLGVFVLFLALGLFVPVLDSYQALLVQ